MNETVRITSASNQIIKEVRSLSNKSGRQSSKAFLLEGPKLVSEAFESGAVIRYFIVSDSFYVKAQELLPYSSDVKVILIPDELFERICETRSPQGILAAAEMPDFDAEFTLQKFKRIIALENLQDPGNLGTIIRTADACGFDAVLISGDSVDPYNPKVVRSTMGALFHLPIIVADDFCEKLSLLQTNGIRIAAAHPRDAIPCWDAEISDNIAIVIGNEGNGLSTKMLNICDFSVMIPMAGKSESLNASAAASILLYESMRQNRMK